MDIPALSIIIPVYNCEKYLAQAISSIMKQPCHDVEILVINDGSKDASGEIADRFSSEHGNIRVFHIPNGGVSAARNLGIREAKGRYMGFLDADDVLCKNAYTEDVRSVLLAEKYDLVSFAHFFGAEDLRRGRAVSAPDGEILRTDPGYNAQVHRNFCSYLFSRNIVTQIGGFISEVHWYEDLGFLFLATRKAKIIRLFSHPWHVYRRNPNSALHSRWNPDSMLEEAHMWDVVKRKCTDEKDKLDCDGNLFNTMMVYIECGCMYGYSVEEIKEKLNNPYFMTTMQKYGTFWMHAAQKELWEKFQQDPESIRKKLRKQGMRFIAKRMLVRIPIVDRIYSWTRYRENIQPFIIDANLSGKK